MDKDDEYTAEEAARRRDAVLKVMVNTPPRPRTSGLQDRAERRKPTGAGRAARKASGRHGKP